MCAAGDMNCRETVVAMSYDICHNNFTMARWLSSCELPVPESATRLRVVPFDLLVPMAQMHHIALMGDSGCRMEAADKAFQDCRDPQAWPFALDRGSCCSQPKIDRWRVEPAAI